MAEKVSEIVGRAVPLDRSDVDTDQIIPSDWLKRVERTGFGEGLFSEWRESSDFVLNRPEYQGDDVRVLVAGPNFGTGSSREHAPWALEDYGFRAIISPRFADIFRNNCLKIGLLPVELPQPVVDRIMSAVQDDPAIEIVVDVPSPARQRPRRHRSHAAARGRHRGLRAAPSTLAAVGDGGGLTVRRLSEQRPESGPLRRDAAR